MDTLDRLCARINRTISDMKLPVEPFEVIRIPFCDPSIDSHGVTIYPSEIRGVAMLTVARVTPIAGTRDYPADVTISDVVTLNAQDERIIIRRALAEAVSNLVDDYQMNEP